MPRRIGITVATRFPRQHERESDEKRGPTHQSNQKEGGDEFNGNASEESKSWSNLIFGSQPVSSDPGLASGALVQVSHEQCHSLSTDQHST